PSTFAACPSVNQSSRPLSTPAMVARAVVCAPRQAVQAARLGSAQTPAATRWHAGSLADDDVGRLATEDEAERSRLRHHRRAAVGFGDAPREIRVVGVRARELGLRPPVAGL